MILKLIAVFILFITWFTDRSGIRRAVLLKMNKQETLQKLDEDPIEDERVELYKTLSYVCIAGFWAYIKYMQIIIPFILLFDVLAYIRHLRYPDKIHCYGGKAKTVPVLTRMYIVAGLNLSFFALSSVSVRPRFIVLVGGLSLLLFLVYAIRCVGYMEKKVSLLQVLFSVICFSIGCVASINSFYGVKVIAKTETTVANVHIGMHTDGITIPEEDALDGETYFSASVRNVQVGDKVFITEREGCLGISWIRVKIDRTGA